MEEEETDDEGLDKLQKGLDDIQSEEEDEHVETPFDHPLFLPVVLLGLSLWFFWDGFVVPMDDHLTFNRGGFAVLSVAAAWFGYKGWKEMRERNDD